MANRRRVIEVSGLHHGEQPIPAAVVVDNFLFTGNISGMDRETGTIPEDIDQEIRNTFSNIEAVVIAAGGSLDDIAKCEVKLRDKAHRGNLNKVWEDYFPDAADRPVRHTSEVAVPPGYNIQVEVTAVVGAAAQ